MVAHNYESPTFPEIQPNLCYQPENLFIVFGKSLHEVLSPTYTRIPPQF